MSFEVQGRKSAKYPYTSVALGTDSTSRLVSPQTQVSRGSSFASTESRFSQHAPSAAATKLSAHLSGGSASISSKFSLSPDPRSWGTDLNPQHPEEDDYLHNPDPRWDRSRGTSRNVFTYRGLVNLGFLSVLCVGIVTLLAGYPIISFFLKNGQSTLGAFNLGGTNASGQVPVMPGPSGLVDVDTPKDAYTINSYNDGSEWQLVFSDEFNTDGRTFYPGDDPYWEAVDLHYWATNNLEWYDPAAITTNNGSLTITLEQKDTHGLNYQGGMLSTWNMFCFTGGMIVASVSLPGLNNVQGLWPAVWTMGNLGRAGYGASLEGTWPYTYDSCDVGTVQNQTVNGQPAAATVNGDPSNGGILSFQVGQRLSRCTCPGESHPGPVHSDGTYVGRAAPEIDIFEAQVSNGVGTVSQSAQWAPFNAGYNWFNTSDNFILPNPSISQLNSYKGAVYQQATSVVTDTSQKCYEDVDDCYSVYGFEYQPGFDNAYITWISEGTVSWTIRQGGTAADPTVEIGPRPVPQEPMYIIANLGMSTNFGPIDFANLPFPVTMKIDYIRVYQPKDSINYGCDPTDFPTSAYINQYIEAYTNPNLTTWKDDYKQAVPKNKFLGQC